ncbi:MAG: hypothetical protein RL243_639, partial [Actinomycetota bacterium]
HVGTDVAGSAGDQNTHGLYVRAEALGAGPAGAKGYK